MAAPLTPEECYQRAVKSMEAGQWKRAIKLLKIATLKAPGDGRFRDALHQATQAHKEAQHEAANVDPRALLKQAQARVADGDAETARKLLQMARARDPKDPEIRAATEQLRALTEAPRTKTDAHTKALQDVTEQANEEAKRPAPPPPRTIAPPSRGRLLALLGALLVLVVIGGAMFFFNQTEHVADESPYTTIFPVQEARVIGVQSEELVLVVARADWSRLDVATRHARLQQTLQRATEQDHTAVFVYDEANVLLGSINASAVYLP